MRLCYLTTMLLFIVVKVESNIPTSSEEVFCTGDILHVVQTSGLFHDDKTFVDFKMKCTKSEIYHRFRYMMKQTDGKPKKAHVRRFVRYCFLPPGPEFERCNPRDWISSPSILSKIKDRNLRIWASELNFLWKVLCRKVRKDVRDNQNFYSLIYVPNDFIIPGGRHREYYYWDSYWTLLGLLHSDMHETAKGMIENLLYLLKKYGFVPNGGRIYFMERSNFPLLIPMAKSYYNKTNDIDFINKHILDLEKEFNFWMEKRVIDVSKDGKTVKLARYDANAMFGPRPDSYKKDIHNAKFFETDAEKTKYYRELKAGCEAGWNFSSRWYRKGNTSGVIGETRPRSIIPVDLNAVIFLNAEILSEFFNLTNDAGKAAKYKQLSETWMKSVTDILWSEEDGVWFDYDTKTNKLRKYYYISNVVPLWAGCYDKENTDNISEKVVNYLNSYNMLDYKGGVPVSLWNTGHHWDFPNAIPSVQHMLIKGLESTNNTVAQEFAFELASIWIRSNYIGFSIMKSMYDTYDARKPGGYGGGQFYIAQAGYGWTNGVILDLLDTYGRRITLRDLNNTVSSRIPISRVVAFLLHTFLLILINDRRFEFNFTI